MRLTFRLAVLTLFASATLTRNADTIYTNFGPHKATTPPQVYRIGFFDNANQVVAMSFVPTETARLTDAILPLDQTIGTSQLNVCIESSSEELQARSSIRSLR